MAAPATRHLTILLTDIKGFTDKTSAKSRADISKMLDEHRAVVLPLLEGKGGTLIKTIGDAFLMTFESPTNAVLAGVEVQEALRRLNEDREQADRLEIRIAINAGEVNLVDGDVFGEAVNITARIEGIAEAGQVWFTEAVYLAMNKAEVPSSEIGLMQLKGIPEKIRVYKVRREEPVGAASAERSRFFGFLPAAGVRSSAAQAAPVPPTWKRSIALLLDGFFCAFLAVSIWGSGSAIRLRKTSKPAAVTADAGGLKIESEGKKVLYDDKKGLRIDVEGDLDEARDQNRRRDWGFAFVWFVYNLVFLKKIGTTPGKRLLRLKVVSMNGAPLDSKQRTMRAAVSLLSGYAAGLGYLWAFWEPQRRGWHDLMADSRVVSD